MNSLEEIFNELRKSSNLCTAIERDGKICYSVVRCKQLCEKHYQRQLKTGSIEPKIKKVKKCKFIDCDEPHRAKGYCTNHYKKFIKSKKKCNVDGCFTPIVSRCLCKKHYERFMKYGDVNGKSSYIPNINEELIKKGKKRYIAPRKNIKCIYSGCDKDYTTSIMRKGLCKNHYYHWHKKLLQKEIT